MASRCARLLLAATLFPVVPGVFGQAATTPAPPEVDQALRTRVTEFFQDFVDGKFRHAINYVAEDTQDEYFGSPKMEIKQFKIDTITYSDNFTNALVHLTVKQIWHMKAEGFMQDAAADTPMETVWRIEDGKWVWTHKVQTSGWLTPMGPSAERKTGDANGIPEKLDEAALAAKAREIMSQAGSGLSTGEVTLSVDKPSSAKVTFHNGVTGSVGISLVGLPNNFPGFSAKLDKQDLNAGEDAIIEISFDPSASSNIPPVLEIGVELQPFSRDIPILIHFPAK